MLLSMRALLAQLLSFIGLVDVYASSLAAPVIKLDIGPFRGSTANGTDVFLGIPYAQPPVGRLRFVAPQPITAKNNTVRDAVQFGNACPQPSGTLGAPVGEDCLFLNVWRPEGTKEGDDLPMLMWIHGGMFVEGAASQPGTDGVRKSTHQSSLVGKQALTRGHRHRTAQRRNRQAYHVCLYVRSTLIMLFCPSRAKSGTETTVSTPSAS